MFTRNAIFDQVIEVGQRVHCSLSHAGMGTVVEINGKQSPTTCNTMFRGVAVSGGSATFSITWDNGNRSNVPEALVRASVQWEVLPNVATTQEIADANALADQKEQESDNAKAKANAEFSAEKERLASDPELRILKQSTEQDSRNSLASANIRKLLKARYPGVKFSVRKEGYTAIRIKWTDGPTVNAVDELAQRFKLGDFDGMTDSYSFKRTPWVELFGGVEYVFCYRDLSDSLIQKAIDQVWEAYQSNVQDMEKPTTKDFRSGSLSQRHAPGISESLSQLIREATKSPMD